MNSHLLFLAVSSRNADLLARADADRRARRPHAVARSFTRRRAGAAGRPAGAAAARAATPAAGCG
jgi:hypothetical protein